MDLDRLDMFARHLGQGESRRRLLGAIGGTALGGLLAAGLTAETDAKKRKKKKKKCKGCSECQLCQKGKCAPKTNGAACGERGTCEDGVCRTIDNCPPAQECDISERCCPQPVVDIGGGIVACETPEATYLCACAGETSVCQFGDGEFADCCTASESCDPEAGCVADN